MAVATTTQLRTLDFGSPAEKGGPHGLFGVSFTQDGESGGGEFKISIAGKASWIRGKILVFRSVVLGTDVTTARAVSLELHPTYLAETQVLVSAKSTVVGRAGSAVEMLDQILVIRANQNPASTTLMDAKVLNTDGEAFTVYVSGEFWIEARLRQENTGPLIRW